MEVSLKFREETIPKLKAKLPLSILSFPFQSALTSGTSKELCIALRTHFLSGPTLGFSYRPNDGSDPFSFEVRAGVGQFGSPVDSPVAVSARFGVGNFGSSPRFCLHFKPRVGDFFVRKCHVSDGGVEFVGKKGDGGGGAITDLPLRGCISEVVEGMEVGAKTELPIINGAVMKFRWGVKFPQGINHVDISMAGILPRRMTMPVLGLNKISIERAAKAGKKEKKEVEVGVQGRTINDVAESCFAVSRQIETLRVENAALREAVADLRAEFGGEQKLLRGGGQASKVQ